MAHAPDPNSRRDTMWFLMPSVLLGTLGVLAPFQMHGAWGVDATWVVAALAGLAGVSTGFVLSDGVFPDGRGGWGRVAALWLGLAMFLPVLVLGHLMGRDVPYLFAGTAVWVIWSAVLFADIFRLSADQACRFSVLFYGLCAAGAAVSVAFPEDVFVWFGTIAILGGWLPAGLINAWVRETCPSPPPVRPAAPEDGDNAGDESDEPICPPSGDADEESDDGYTDPPWPAVPPQTLSGRALFKRWVIAVTIDYGIIAAPYFLIVISPRGPFLLEFFIVSCGAYLFYQPIGERFGGTMGQRVAGIRLVEPGTPTNNPSMIEVGYRHLLRVGVIWGGLSALAYWAEAAFIGPAERARIAQGANGPPYRPWMFIERSGAGIQQEVTATRRP